LLRRVVVDLVIGADNGNVRPLPENILGLIQKENPLRRKPPMRHVIGADIKRTDTAYRGGVG